MLVLENGADFIVVNKPAGFATHQVDQGYPGLREILMQELGLSELYVVHRLDKTTTGILIFAKTKRMAQILSDLFLQKKAQKRYLFLTKSTPQLEQDDGASRTHSSDMKGLAITIFKRVKLNALFQLWEAQPQTGRTHQIRKHAQDLGFPILGDSQYGGAPYPHLCLHALELTLPGVGTWSVSPPPFFDRMGLIRDLDLGHILASIDLRKRFFGLLKKTDQAYRMMHLESKDYRVDIFGKVFWVYWYLERTPTDLEIQRFEFVAGFLGKTFFLRQMKNRGESPLVSQALTVGQNLSPWIFQENQISFEGRTDCGLSPGLFLDQRCNRKWLLERVQGKTVLNLFAYTCGFSVAAALGQAAGVTSVDLSRKFLDWGKRNFQLNSLPLDAHSFFAMDSEKFLDSAAKKKRSWDYIILDPPSFSRSGKDIFRIEKDLPRLVDKSIALLAPRGKILCSSNFEGWDQDQMKKKIESGVSKKLRFSALPFRPWDFELPKQKALMNSWLIEVDSPQARRS